MARYSHEMLERIRESVSFIELAGRYTTLKRSGHRWKGLCPFHREKTPSFHIDEERGLFHCFGCGRGGDIFAFVQEAEGFSFGEAVHFLAEQAGIPIEMGKSGGDITPFMEALAFAHNKFKDYLASPKGTRAREYLEKRGVSERLIKEIGIGYIPTGWDNLLNALKQSRRDIEPFITVGLIGKSEQGKLFDTFRNGVIIPIRNRTSKVIAFGMRSLSIEGPKYINSPEHPAYHKKMTLFGLDRARRQIRDVGEAILVEGYFDAIRLYDCDVDWTVATCGTALTPEQATLISRYTHNVLLIYDGDSAGVSATLRAIPILLAAGLMVRVILLPDGDDPDTFFRGKEPPEIAEIFASLPRDWFDIVMEHEIPEPPISIPDKLKAADILKSYLTVISDRDAREMYISQAADRLKIDEDRLSARLGPNTTEKTSQNDEKRSIRSHRELIILSALVADNSLFKLLPEENFMKLYPGVLRELESFYADRGRVSVAELESLLTREKDIRLAGTQLFEIDSSERAHLVFAKTLQSHLEDVMQEEIEKKRISLERAERMNEHSIVSELAVARDRLAQHYTQVIRCRGNPMKLLEILPEL